jgi:Ca2+-binding EF-hand superfamily protein
MKPKHAMIAAIVLSIGAGAALAMQGAGQGMARWNPDPAERGGRSGWHMAQQAGPGMMRQGMQGQQGMRRDGMTGRMQRKTAGGSVGPMMAERLAQIDTDGDGRIGGGELMEWRETVFSAMDVDGDEVLTRDEYMAVQFGRGADADQRGPRYEMMQQAKAAEFDAMDADGVGRVTRDQFTDMAASAFLQADADGDGALSAAEFPQMHAHR